MVVTIAWLKQFLVLIFLNCCCSSMSEMGSVVIGLQWVADIYRALLCELHIAAAMPSTSDVRWHQMKQITVVIFDSLCGSQVKANLLCAIQEHIAKQLPDNPGGYSALILQHMRSPTIQHTQRQTAIHTNTHRRKQPTFDGLHIYSATTTMTTAC